MLKNTSDKISFSHATFFKLTLIIILSISKKFLSFERDYFSLYNDIFDVKYVNGNEVHVYTEKGKAVEN